MKIAYNDKFGNTSWYRKLGLCFDLVTNEKYASDLTNEECEKVMAQADYIYNMYGVSGATVIE